MEIEKNVPLPDKPRIRSEYSKRLEEMEEGDSVVYSSAKEADALRAAGMYRGYIMKKHRDEKTGGFRVWLWKRSGAKPKVRVKAPRPATPLAMVISAPLVRVPTEAPPVDDPRVAELHALCLARRCRVTVFQAQKWAGEGVTAEQLREALTKAPSTASALDAILHGQAA